MNDRVSEIAGRVERWENHPARDVGQIHGHETCDGDGCDECVALEPLFGPRDIRYLLVRLARLERVVEDVNLVVHSARTYSASVKLEAVKAELAALDDDEGE